MSTMQESARHCAGLFRLGREVEGAVQMVEVLSDAAGLLERAPQTLQVQFAAVLGELLAAQQRQDWIALADSLEYELPSLIDQAASV